jgi:hypothetical protein
MKCVSPLVKGERRGGVIVFPPQWKPDEQDAGDHKGPPSPTSAALAPTGVDEPFLRLMRVGRPCLSSILLLQVCGYPLLF